ncbi:MAG: hypothetical protein EOO38_04010 [Cytophagaceae bacterium]|nr:MAG: hypothetical protein EOO38_04010 [Cytophagaceae bacterium]
MSRPLAYFDYLTSTVQNMPTNSKSEVAHTNSDRAANKPPHDYANGHVVDEVVYAAPHFILPPGAQWVPVTTMPPYRKVGWRKGKWFDEEEAYTKKLIEVFTNGYLNIPGGTTLRCYLADRLSW